MDTDLHQIIRSDQPLTDDHCQVLAFHNFSLLFISYYLLLYDLTLLLFSAVLLVSDSTWTQIHTFSKCIASRP